MDFIPIWQEEQIYIYMQEKTRNDILSLIEITQNQRLKKYDTTYI